MKNLFYVVLKSDNDIWYTGTYLECKEWIKNNIKYIYTDKYDVVWYLEYERRLEMFKSI